MFCTPLAHILNRETVALGQVTTDEPPLLVPGGRDDAAVILGEYPQHMICVMYVCIYIYNYTVIIYIVACIFLL